jgi:nucleoside-diphosphate-sugar epimerase
MSSLSNPRLSKGSLVLITGVTGYIGSHIADQALALGYKVRGAVRSVEKAAWLQDLFDKRYGPDSFTTALLSDALDTAAVENAVKGVNGIIDVAVDSQLSSSPTPYIPNTIRRTLNILEASAKTSTVKSVVITSSSMAAIPWKSDVEYTISPTSYNEEFIKLAWDPTFTDPSKLWMVYAAAKAQSEQAAWKFISENNVDFVLNTVLPSANFGPALNAEHQGLPSTGAWPKMLFEGDLSVIGGVPPQYFVDVRDTARVHVGALINRGTEGERLWTFGEPYNWNQILKIYRRIYPGHKFIDDIEGVGVDKSLPPNKPAEDLLKVFGQMSWTSLEDSIKESLASLGLGT